MSEGVDVRSSKLILSRKSDEVMTLELKMINVLIRGPTGHKGIININECKRSPYRMPFISKSLKRLTSITQTEQYLQELPKTNWHCYSGLVDILLVNQDLVILVDQISFAENGGTN